MYTLNSQGPTFMALLTAASVLTITILHLRGAEFLQIRLMYRVSIPHIQLRWFWLKFSRLEPWNWAWIIIKALFEAHFELLDCSDWSLIWVLMDLTLREIWFSGKSLHCWLSFVRSDFCWTTASYTSLGVSCRAFLVRWL